MEAPPNPSLSGAACWQRVDVVKLRIHLGGTLCMCIICTLKYPANKPSPYLNHSYLEPWRLWLGYLLVYNRFACQVVYSGRCRPVDCTNSVHRAFAIFRHWKITRREWDRTFPCGVQTGTHVWYVRANLIIDRYRDIMVLLLILLWIIFLWKFRGNLWYQSRNILVVIKYLRNHHGPKRFIIFTHPSFLEETKRYLFIDLEGHTLPFFILPFACSRSTRWNARLQMYGNVLRLLFWFTI